MRADLLHWTSLVSECLANFRLQIHLLDTIRRDLLWIWDVCLFLRYWWWHFLGNVIIWRPFHIDLLPGRCRFYAHRTCIRYDRLRRDSNGMTWRPESTHGFIASMILTALDQILARAVLFSFLLRSYSLLLKLVHLNAVRY